MLALAFFSWWYGKGWKLVSQKLLQAVDATLKMFSVNLLFKTLFKPWRRIITYPGAGISAHFHALIDNTISRFVGLMVRLIVIFAALVVVGLVLVIGLLQLIIWPLLPFAVIASLIMGLV